MGSGERSSRAGGGGRPGGRGALRVARAALAACCFGLVTAVHAIPDDAAVREALRQRIEVGHRGVGLVVGIVDASGSRVIAYGRTERDGGLPVDGDSVFEIGSVTKVFTSLLLAEMASRGEVKLHDPIAKYVPRSVTSPRAKDITLLHLSRHTAGLPFFPGNLDVVDWENPFGDYADEQLFAELNAYKTRRTVGTRHSYSNYGMALLGEVLARAAHRDFETLLRERIFQPLGMDHTGITLTAEMRAHHARGHSARNRPLPVVEKRGHLGSGAVRSSANDLLVFLAANLGLRPSPLAAAMRAAQFTTADTQMPDLPMGLGWFHAKGDTGTIVWHNGATAGSRAYIGMDPERKRGVVVLSNSNYSIDELGPAILKDLPLPNAPPSPPREFKAVAVDAEALGEYAGDYKLAPSDKDSLRFAREGDHLVLRGHRDMRVFPEGKDAFFTEDMEAWGTFTRDPSGHVAGLEWQREGWKVRLERVPR